MKPKMIYQGAEAKIFLSDNFIIKDRIPKSYRIKELDDKIRVQRTRSETKLLTKASNIINSPKPFFEPTIKNSTIIKMPFIQGKKLSEHLDNFPLEKQKEILKKIGEETAKLHDAEIIHGDLTTSNLILVDNNNLTTKKRGDIISSSHGWAGGEDENSPTIFFIDFGLGFISNKAEDKAVDIHLLKQALEAKHFRNWEILYQEFLKGYKKSKNHERVLEKLKVVEKRGRYRH